MSETVTLFRPVGAEELALIETSDFKSFPHLIVLRENQPDYQLYLAITEEVFLDFFHEKDLGGLVTKSYSLSIIVFDPHEEEIIRWIN